MSKIFILNASPVILLGKAGLLSTVSPLATRWVIPDRVVAEVEAKRPIGHYWSELATGSEVIGAGARQINPEILSWDLGPGESEVLTLAVINRGATVVLDDLLARKCATVLGFPLVGSIGLLLAAKRADIIASVRPEIEKLIKAGLRIDQAMLLELYARLGE